MAKGAKARRVPLWWDRSTLADLTDWRDERQGAASGEFYLKVSEADYAAATGQIFGECTQLCA